MPLTRKTPQDMLYVLFTFYTAASFPDIGLLTGWYVLSLQETITITQPDLHQIFHRGLSIFCIKAIMCESSSVYILGG